MGLTLNPLKYGRLCAEALPKVIESDEEFDRMVEFKEEIDFKPAASREEKALSALLGRLIQEYDDRVHPLPNVPPHKLIAYLMEQRGLRQSDLVPEVFGSRSEASDVIGGRREPSKAHIRGLARFFKLSADAFL